MIDLPDGKFSIVYADPPWAYNDNLFNSNTGIVSGNAEQQYATMTQKELLDMDVVRIVYNTALLFLWATGPLMPDAMQLGNKWGFHFSHVSVVWNKTKPNPGHYTVSQTELLLAFTRGGAKPRDGHLFISKQICHSRKPEQIRRWIDSTWPRVKKIELFARRTAPGWTSWGNEVDKHDNDFGFV